jgi:hypothetical protein
VNVEARYAPGTGVLIGAGGRWLLVSDPGDEEVVAQLWDAVSSPAAPASGTSTVEQVLAIVEKAFGGDPPALAMVDLTVGGSSTVSRGRGHVRLAGADRVLSLAGGSDPASLPRPRRLLGGVVAADLVELRPLSGRVAAPPATVRARPPAPAADGLIDGIPADILAAKGPDGPPPRPRVRRPAAEAGADTGPLHDTTEPPPGFASERIHEGGHTTIRPPVTRTGEPEGASPEPAEHDEREDHDGSTVHRPAHLVPGTTSTVLAVSCPLGHLTPPASPSCRTCHQRVAPQEPRRVSRPTLGGLRLPTGEVVPLDRGVVLGRRPAPVEGSGDWPHLVHLPSDHSFVSRMHLQVELDGWDVVARDLDSRGGTTIAPPGRDPERMRPRDAYVLEPGTVLDLAEVYAVRYETGPVAVR